MTGHYNIFIISYRCCWCMWYSWCGWQIWTDDCCRICIRRAWRWSRKMNICGVTLTSDANMPSHWNAVSCVLVCCSVSLRHCGLDLREIEEWKSKMKFLILCSHFQSLHNKEMTRMDKHEILLFAENYLNLTICKCGLVIWAQIGDIFSRALDYITYRSV